MMIKCRLIRRLIWIFVSWTNMSRIERIVASRIVFFMFHSTVVSVSKIYSLPSELSKLEKALLAVCFLLRLRFIYCTENCWRSNIVCHDRSPVLPQLDDWDFFYCEVVDITITFVLIIISFIYLLQYISICFSFSWWIFFILISLFFVLKLKL